MDWPEKLRLLTRGRYGAKADLHRRTGFPMRSISRWIKGGKLPRNELRVVSKLAKALGVDESWFRDSATAMPPVPRGPRPEDAAATATASAGTEYAAIFRALADPALLPKVREYCELLLLQTGSRGPLPTRHATAR